VKLNIHFYLVAELKMRGALSPLLIVWCIGTGKLGNSPPWCQWIYT